MILDVGRLCIKTAGREAGKLCVIVKKVDETFVFITGPKELTHVKRRKCNIAHLEPLHETIKIKSDAPDTEIVSEYKKSNIVEKFGGLKIEKPKIMAQPVEEPKHTKKDVKEHKEETAPKKAEPAKETPKKEAKPVKKVEAAKKTAPKKAAAKSAKKTAKK